MKAMSQSLSARWSPRAREPNRIAAFALGYETSAFLQASSTALQAVSRSEVFAVALAPCHVRNRRFEGSATGRSGFGADIRSNSARASAVLINPFLDCGKPNLSVFAIQVKNALHRPVIGPLESIATPRFSSIEQLSAKEHFPLRPINRGQNLNHSHIRACRRATCRLCDQTEKKSVTADQRLGCQAISNPIDVQARRWQSSVESPSQIDNASRGIGSAKCCGIGGR